MRRSTTTYQPAIPPISFKRATTITAVPPLSHVEEKLEGLDLIGSRFDNEEFCVGSTRCPSDSDEKEFKDINYTALPGEPEAKNENANGSVVVTSLPTSISSPSSSSSSSQETETQAKRDFSFQSNNSTLEGVPSSSSEYEGDLEEEACADTFDTSANDSLPPENVHKPLKDLIFKANKEFYDVDSNKVRIKVGLSKKVPSLHPKRRIHGASSMQ